MTLMSVVPLLPCSAYLCCLRLRASALTASSPVLFVCLAFLCFSHVHAAMLTSAFIVYFFFLFLCESTKINSEARPGRHILLVPSELHILVQAVALNMRCSPPEGDDLERKKREQASGMGKNKEREAEERLKGEPISPIGPAG